MEALWFLLIPIGLAGMVIFDNIYNNRLYKPTEEVPERWVYQKKDRTLQIQQHEDWDRESGLYDRAIDRAYKASEAYRLEQELDAKLLMTNPLLWAKIKEIEQRNKDA